jgi:hypothetical protein
VVKDLGTTVSGVQSAIALEALVSAMRLPDPTPSGSIEGKALG